MSILNHIPTELPYFGLKWRLYYTNGNDKLVDLCLYKKDFAGTNLATEDLLDILTEDGQTLTPGMLFVQPVLATENDLLLSTEGGASILLGAVSEGVGEGGAAWAPILYDQADVTTAQSFADSDFFRAISGSAMQLKIYAFDENEFAELREAENFQYYFELKIEERLINTGYIVPETYRQDWGSLPHLISVSATDGLGMLRDIPLTITEDVYIKGIHRVSDVISFILYKAGNRGKWYDASIYVGNNVTSKGRKFAWNTFVDMSQWEEPNGHQVLEELLESINAQLIRYKDGFLIRHVDERRINIPAIEYSWAGAFIKPVMINLPNYTIQDNGKTIGRSTLQTEKPAGSIELKFKKYIHHDISQPDPPMEWIHHEWMPGWLEGEIIDPKTIHIKQAPHPQEPPLPGQITDIGLLINDVIDPLRYRPSTLQYMRLTADLVVEWIGGNETVTIPTSWIMSVSIWHGSLRTHLLHIPFNPSVTTKQEVDLVFRMDIAHDLRIFLHPIDPIFPENINWQVDHIVFENWELRIVKNAKGDDYEEDTDTYNETYHSNNRTQIKAEKHLGFFPTHAFGAMIWENAYMYLDSGKYRTIQNWTNGADIAPLPDLLKARYAAYYAFNKFRYSILLAHRMDTVFLPLMVIEDTNIEQVFRAVSMRMVPKLEQYSLELIGFGVK